MHPLLELNVHYYFFLFHRRPVGNHRACTYVPHAVLQVHYHPFSDVNIFAFSCSILKQIKDGVSMFSTTILHVWGQSGNYFLISDGVLAIFCLISVSFVGLQYIRHYQCIIMRTNETQIIKSYEASFVSQQIFFITQWLLCQLYFLDAW